MTEIEAHSKGRTAALGDRLAHAVIIYLVALLLTLPLFIILLPFVPELSLPMSEGVRVDHILTFLVILIAFIVLVRQFQIMVYGILIIGALALTVSSVIGHYTFGNMYEDYAGLLRSLRDTAASAPLASQRLKPFHDADKLRRLVMKPDQPVRKKAVRMATANFSDVNVGVNEFTMVQAFSIFKEINHKWKYVSDVKGEEYFAPPDESLELMAGDCDDHAVLMATCIKAIGGEVRLVRTEGHVYPEMKIGTDEQLERAAYLIRKELFTKEVGDAPLYHHTDSDGLHWINLDYTRDYPGGELMNERIVGILDL